MHTLYHAPILRFQSVRRRLPVIILRSKEDLAPCDEVGIMELVQQLWATFVQVFNSLLILVRAVEGMRLQFGYSHAQILPRIAASIVEGKSPE